MRPTKKRKGPTSVKKKKEDAGPPSRKIIKKELEAEKQVWKWWEEENELPDSVQ